MIKHSYTVLAEKIHLLTSDHVLSHEELLSRVRAEDALGRGSLSTYNLRVIREEQEELSSDGTQLICAICRLCAESLFDVSVGPAHRWVCAPCSSKLEAPHAR